MTKIVLNRLLAVVPMLLAVSVLAFVLVNASKSNVVAAILGDAATPEASAALEKKLGLDEALWHRYADWLGAVFKGDLGVSYVDGSSVWDALGERLPVTLSLAIGGLLLTIVFGVAAGILAARRPGGALDRVITFLGSGLIALPSFWAGMMLTSWVGVQLGWLPTGGYVPFSESPALWLSCLVLPCIALALTPIASVARQMRASMITNLDSDYIRTARAKGVGPTRLITHHALRNALGPVATVIGFQFATMIGGAFVIEVIFSLPGLGGMTVPGVLNSDAPVLMGVIMVVAVAVLLTNLIVDLLYNYFDPRVREL